MVAPLMAAALILGCITVVIVWWAYEQAAKKGLVPSLPRVKIMGMELKPAPLKSKSQTAKEGNIAIKMMTGIDPNIEVEEKRK